VESGTQYGQVHFDKLRRGNCTLYIHKDVRNDTFEQTLLAGEEQLHKRYHSTAVRSSKFSSVCKFIVRFGDVEKVIYLKEYFCRSAWDFVKHLFRPSRARRALKAAFMLAENGFESPAIVAMGQCRFAFFTTRNFIATLEVENARSVYQNVVDNQSSLNTGQFQMKRSLAGAFGRTIGRMHAGGIFHGDLRLGNVLARKEQDDWRFFFLDNERTKKFRRLPGRLRLKNLVQINMFEPWAASNTDRMRFFKEYWAGSTSSPQAENKESKLEKAAWVRRAHHKLIRKVLKKTSRRLRKKQGPSTTPGILC